MKAHRLTRIGALLVCTAALAAALAATSCSVVFTAGINGRVVDAEEFESDPSGGGVNGVRVYLYLRERPRTADRERFETEGLLPDEGDGDDYYLVTVTDVVGGEAGAFSFPTIYWNDLLPTYGRTGDRRDIFLLLHHPEYGLVDHTATIVSDTTNTLAPVELTWIYETATLEGRLERAGSTAGIAGTTVKVHVADGYDGAIFTYPTAPTEEVTTGANGNYAVTISMLRDTVDAAGGGRALLTFQADGYLATTAADSDLAEDRDVDGDGANDVYYGTPLIPPGETTRLASVSLKQISFTEELSGRVGVDTDADGNIDAGTNGAVVSIYINRASAPDPTDPPDLTTTTGNLLVDQNVQAGWFSFAEITWDDEAYAGSQSSITCYLDVDVNGDGTIDVGAGDIDNRLVTVYSNTANTVQIVL